MTGEVTAGKICAGHEKKYHIYFIMFWLSVNNFFYIVFVHYSCLQSKHTLDLSVLCLDARLCTLLELTESAANNASFYDFVHPEDVQYVAEAHAAGEFSRLKCDFVPIL